MGKDKAPLINSVGKTRELHAKSESGSRSYTTCKNKLKIKTAIRPETVKIPEESIAHQLLKVGLRNILGICLQARAKEAKNKQAEDLNRPFPKDVQMANKETQKNVQHH